MTCAHCHDLETLRAENAYLRSELGLVHDAQIIVNLRTRFGLWLTAAKLLSALHLAHGRVLSKDHLVEAIGSHGESGKGIDVLVFKIRRTLGFDAIETIVGQGLRIGPSGTAAVQAAQTMARAA